MTGGREGEGRFQVLDPDLALVWKGVIVALLAADLPQQLADEFGGSADWSMPTAVIAAAVGCLSRD